MPVIRKRYFPYTVTIDDQPVRLKIKRLTVPEYEEFAALFAAHAAGRGNPARVVPEQESAEDAKARLALVVGYLKDNADWLLTAFEQYVSVEPGDLFDEDDDGAQVEVTSGRKFAEMFGGQTVVSDVLARIWLENSLTEDQKKKLLSRSASANGSSAAPGTAAAGEPPALTAESAEPVDSAVLAAAMAPSSDTSSGTTGPSS